MAKKSPPPFRIPRTQRVVAKEITDPAELAAAEATEKRHREARDAAARLVAECGRLSHAEQVALISGVAARLPADELPEGLARLLTELPPSLVLRAEKALRPCPAE